jgi:hypothetical protein
MYSGYSLELAEFYLKFSPTPYAEGLRGCDIQ